MSNSIFRRRLTEREASRFFDIYWNDPEFAKERDELYKRYNKALDREMDELREKYKKKHWAEFLKTIGAG